MSFGTKPWGVTFESALPRLTTVASGHPMQRVLRRRLLSERCKFIVGISEFARQTFLDSLTGLEENTMAEKLFTVPPYQACNSSAAQEPLGDSIPLTLIFVGRDFFRKGGEALLLATERAGEALNVRTVIVSDVRGGDYATRFIDPLYTAEIRKRLAKNTRVEWYESLTNGKVLELMATSNVGVLPTLADTYGFSLLESMSLGLPIIGTNVQAGPEITISDVGWRLDVELGPDRYWTYVNSRSSAGYREAVESLSAGIVGVLKLLRERPRLLSERSKAALERVATFYGREREMAMYNVYQATLS